MLYVANISRHHQVLEFRNAAKDAGRREIRPGGQIYIDAPQPSLAAAVAHMQRYGAIEVAALPQGRPFNGVAYQFGTPIDDAAIPTSLDRFAFPAGAPTDGRP